MSSKVHIRTKGAAELATERTDACPGCCAQGRWEFFRASRVPLAEAWLPTREAALASAMRDLRLFLCSSCGLIRSWGSRAEAATGRLDEEIDAVHLERIARQLVRRHGLRGGRVTDVACGSGALLAHLCRDGENRGIGFFHRPELAGPGREPIVAPMERPFTDEHNHHCDLVTCCMVLHRLSRPGELLGRVRRAVASHPGTVVSVVVPDVTRVLRRLAFWEVSHDRVNYLGPASLVRLLRSTGFEILRVGSEAATTLLTVDARSGAAGAGTYGREGDLEELIGQVSTFARQWPQQADLWRLQLQEMAGRQATVVLWGRPRSTISFLNIVASEGIECVVDPRVPGTPCYVPGTGHPVIGLADLGRRDPDVVIVTDPLEREPASRAMGQMGLRCRVMET